MKKLLALLMALTLVVFTGCSGKETKTEVKTEVKTGAAKTEVKTTIGKTDVKTGVTTDVKTGVTTDVKTGVTTDVKTDVVKTDVKTDVVKTDVKTDVKPPPAVEGKVTKVEGKNVTVKVGDKDYVFEAADADAAKAFKADEKVDVWLKDGKAINIKEKK